MVQHPTALPLPKKEGPRHTATVSWALLLHFYQPPHQLPSIIRRVVEESYLPLLEVFRAHPQARATVNICGVLTETLWESGYREVIHQMRELAERGQFEFTGSAKYHPILPLIPEAERVRQIRRNFLANQHFFGEVYQPRGFFPPEMAYSADIVKSVVESRHQWIILSGVACPAAWPTTQVYEIPWEDESLAVLFRDDILSNKISFQNIHAHDFLGHLRHLNGDHSRSYVITAMDAETFGHHIPKWEETFLGAVFDLIRPEAQAATTAALAKVTEDASRALDPAAVPLVHRHLGPESAADGYAAPTPSIRSVTISEIVDGFLRGPQVQPKASSWSTSAEDLAHDNVFPLWDDPGNPLHKLLWKHMRLATEMVLGAEEMADNDASRNFAGIGRALLDQALHSCQFWWASRRPMWDVNMVHRGLLQQEEAILNACRAIHVSGCPEQVKDEYFYRFAACRDLGNRITDLLINM
ncbi:MAG: hypothetical protein HY689_15615 [Chloroflexi bacterium]|nr:hypothetical protein [Chloroflexota bacterium]